MIQEFLTGGQGLADNLSGIIFVADDGKIGALRKGQHFELVILGVGIGVAIGIGDLGKAIASVVAIGKDTAVVHEAEAHGATTKLIVYPAFTPQDAGGVAPGHMIFGREGWRIWEADVKEFLGKYLGER